MTAQVPEQSTGRFPREGIGRLIDCTVLKRFLQLVFVEQKQLAVRKHHNIQIQIVKLEKLQMHLIINQIVPLLF